MVTIMGFLKRKPGVSREEFQKYWVEKHVPFVMQVPGIRRYVVHVVQKGFHPTGGPEGMVTEDCDFDGVAELWFDDMESAVKAWSTPQGTKDLGHFASFIGGSVSALCEPTVKIQGP